MTFQSLGLNNKILKAISEEGYETPTPIQEQAIPVIMEGRDVLGGAPTGTGKTAGFTLPLLHRLAANPRQGAPAVRALILAPTRELAAQVGESVRTYSKHLRLRSAIIFGGVNMGPQKRQLRQGVDILVATPGRLLDHVGQKTVDLSKVEILILDEADRMLDMGFIHDIKRIEKLIPEKRQSLLFSATYSNEIKKLTDTMLKDPVMIEVAKSNATSAQVTQTVYPVDRAKKHKLLCHLIQSNNWKQVLIFTRTKHGANKLAEQLEKSGISASAIHGNKSQSARMQALALFKKNKVSALVATDIASRGIDIDTLPHVVNFELPNTPEDYVHRIGRTGRAGSKGEAISLVCVDEKRLLSNIERLIQKDLPRITEPGFEPDPTIKAEPIRKRRQPHRRNKSSGPAPSFRARKQQPKGGGKRKRFGAPAFKR